MNSVIVLGAGCRKCQKLEEKVRDLIDKNGIDAEVKKVSDIDVMLKYNIMMTPGLVVNGEVKSAGVIPKDEQLIQWLKGE